MYYKVTIYVKQVDFYNGNIQPENTEYVHSISRFQTQLQATKIKVAHLSNATVRVEILPEPTILPDSEIINFIKNKKLFYDSRMNGKQEITYCIHCEEQTKQYHIFSGKTVLTYYCFYCRYNYKTKIKIPISTWKLIRTALRGSQKSKQKSEPTLTTTDFYDLRPFSRRPRPRTATETAAEIEANSTIGTMRREIINRIVRDRERETDETNDDSNF